MPWYHKTRHSNGSTAMSDAPVKKFRLGFVSASIFKNEGQERAFYGVKLQRTYKGDDGQLQNTDGLNHGDCLNAVKLLQRAEAWIAEQQ